MSEETSKKVTLAKCGMDCTSCRFAEENDCPGCMYCLCGKKLFEDEECEVGICCTEKGFTHCGQCGEFPCDILKEVSFDVQTGDGGNRLLTLKALSESERDRKRLNLTPPVCGTALGISAGIIIGAVTGMAAAWTVAGAIFGCGTGAIISVVKTGDIKALLPAKITETVPASEDTPAETPKAETHKPRTDTLTLFDEALRSIEGRSPSDELSENKDGE